MFKKKFFLIFFIISLFFISGCWDMIDIERRLFVVGVGIDKPSQEEIERQRKVLEEPENFTPRYLITYLSPVPSAKIEAGGGEGSYFTKSTTAITLDAGVRQISTRIDKRLFFGHSKLVLFGEDILKDKNIVLEMIDYLQRNQDYNWHILVGVVEGKAQDVLNIEPKGAKGIVPYITGIMESRQETSRVADVTLKQFIVNLGHEGIVALPRLVVAPDEVKVEGVAIIKDFKLLGYLSGLEGRSLMFLKGTIEGGSVVIKYLNEFIPFAIVQADVKKKLKVTDEGLQLTYSIETEGQLNEGIYNRDFSSIENIRTIEKLIEEEIVRDCNRVIKRLQKEFKVDIIYGDKYINHFHPKIWNEIKDNYLEVFEDMDIRVEADVKIRRTGIVK
ncbi:MAG TPA: Ger(x)C family spore germination protein [Eubacteriaceae bacterium]|nr:Ger(x)C family spore germination protein [Eubacteriaceae bacterium]